MNKQMVEGLLRKFDIFKDLSDIEMEPIIELTKYRTQPKGTHVFFQDDPMTNIYFINWGKVKIYKTDFNGKEQIMNILKAGDMFPHQGFFNKDANYPAHAVVYEETMLAYIPIEDFRKLLITQPDICMKLLQVLSVLIADLQTRLGEKIMNDTREQIIKLLLRLTQSHGEKLDGGKIVLTTPFTNQELANMIGSSRESVSRTLSNLRKNKMVLNDRDGHIVIDFPKLHEEIIY